MIILLKIFNSSDVNQYNDTGDYSHGLQGYNIYIYNMHNINLNANIWYFINIINNQLVVQ